MLEMNQLLSATLSVSVGDLLKPSSSKSPHDFEKASFKKFTYCAFCSNFIWGMFYATTKVNSLGISKQGFQCKGTTLSLYILNFFQFVNILVTLIAWTMLSSNLSALDHLPVLGKEI